MLLKRAIPKAAVQPENVHAIKAQPFFCVKLCPPDAVGVFRLVQKYLPIQTAQLCGRVDIKHEQPAGLQRIVYAPERLPAVVRTRQIVEAVQRADHRVHRLRQTKPLHRLADEKRAAALRQLPRLPLCLRQHILRQICADHPVSAPGQQHGQ